MADDDFVDRELIRRCLDGQPQAWEAFVRRHGPELARMIRAALARARGTAEPALVQDLLQETFLRLWADDCAKLRAFRWECPLPFYLRIFAVRAVQYAMRKGHLAWSEAGADALARDLASGGGDAAWERLETSETEDRLEKALHELAPRERLALRLAYWESWPADDACEVVGLTRNAFHVLLHRAREKLGRILGTLCL